MDKNEILDKIDQFFLHHKHVICYGAGKNGRIFWEYGKLYHKNIEFIVISDTQVDISNGIFPVKKLAEVKDLSKYGIVLSVNENVQLDIIPNLKGVCIDDILFFRSSWTMTLHNEIQLEKLRQNLLRKNIGNVVCFFSHYVELYGANKSMLENIRLLHSLYRIQPIVVTLGMGMLNEELDHLEIPNLAFNFSLWVNDGNDQMKNDNNKVIDEIVSTLYPCNIDIIHTNSTVLDIGARVALQLKIPHIWHLREFLEEDYNLSFILPRNKAIHFMEQSSDALVFISNKLKQKYKKYIQDDSKIYLIYNGVDSSEYYSIRNKEEFYGEKVNVIVCGLISENKNQMEVIKAISLLPLKLRENIKVQFLGNGDEKYIDSMKKHIISKGLEQQIEFCGRVSNVSEYVHKSHIGIMPSKCEAFGRVTVEYMMAGMAVIVSDAGANDEIVSAGKCGLVYHFGDANSLCEQIKFYIDNRNAMYKYSRRGQEYVKNKFSTQRVVKELNSLYKDILSRYKDRIVMLEDK